MSAKIEQIDDEERRDNAAFEKWLQADFPELSASKKRDLCDYVGGLNCEIGNLKAVIVHLEAH